MSLFVDFVGLNTLVSSSFETDTFDNILTANRNAIIGTIPESELLVATNIHRNGPYNFATFKQIRIHENPLTRYQRRNNLLSFSKRSEQKEITDSNNNVLFIQEKFGDLVTFTEPAVVSSYHPLVYNLGTLQGDKVKSFNRFGLSFDYGNHITYFTNEELNKLLLLDDLDDEVYEQIKELYLNGALETNASEVDYFEFLRYKQDIYPREINKYSAAVRSRSNYQNDFWRDVRADRNRTQDTGFTNTVEHSMWNLDAVTDWSTRSSINIDDPTGMGQLQYVKTHFSLGGTGLKVGPSYTRMHSVTTPESVVSPSGINISDATPTNLRYILFQGDALWEAGEQAGKNPFYSSYDYFVEELRGIGKDYSIVPEFRISEHVETLLKKGNLQKLSNIFEITGGAESSNASDESGFYETYSNSDFMKHFASIKEDHKDFEDPATITLTCKALKKFLAYDSFYPQDRSVDCAKQFYSSYSSFIVGQKRNIFDILFSPGTLYNTIKSGVAVDYPILSAASSSYAPSASDDVGSFLITNSFHDRIPFEALVEPEKYISDLIIYNANIHPSGTTSATARWDGKGDNLYTKMMSNYLAEIPEFFLQGSQLSTIASEEQGSDNFGVAESGKTYAMRLKIFKTLDEANTVIPRASSGEGGYNTPQALSGKEETITMYSRPSAFGPPCAGYKSSDETKHYDSRDGFNPAFTPPYYDGEAWIDFIWTAPEAGSAAALAGQSTGKYSLSEILSNVTASAIRFDSVQSDFDNFGSKGVLNTGPYATNSSLTIQGPVGNQFNNTYYNQSLRPMNYNAMQLLASVNSLQSGKIVSRDSENDTLLNENIQQTIDANKGATNARWIIQTKFETPILNFKDVSLITASVNMESGQTPRGMWHQYGVIPNNNEGIYMQIEDLSAGWLKYKNSSDATKDDTWYLTGSLADLCGFSTAPVKLGQISQGRVISEAVVAVPYINDGGVKKFFEINENNFNAAKKYFQAVGIVNQGGNPDNLGLGNPEFWEERAGSSVIDQVRKMKRYVFPPTMDFFNYPEVTPFSMYIFEFRHTLTQQDLADMWQGIPPEIGTSFEVAEDSISHPLLANQLLGAGEGTDKSRIGADLEGEIRWMVFKVKKRAKTNYFDKVVGKKAGYGQAAAAAGFSTNASSETAAQSKISYNWPYDFFSLVELVKIDAEIEFSNIPEGKFEPKKREIPEAVQQFAANLSRRRR